MMVMFGIKVRLWTKAVFSHISSCGYAGSYPHRLSENLGFHALPAIFDVVGVASVSLFMPAAVAVVHVE